MKKSAKTVRPSQKLACTLVIEPLESRFYPGSTMDLFRSVALGAGFGWLMHDRWAAALSAGTKASTGHRASVLEVDPSQVALVSAPPNWEEPRPLVPPAVNPRVVVSSGPSGPARLGDPLPAAIGSLADGRLTDPLASEWDKDARGRGPVLPVGEGVRYRSGNEGGDGGGMATTDRSALPSTPVESTWDGANGDSGAALSADPAPSATPVPANPATPSGPIASDAASAADDGLNLINTQGPGTLSGGPDWSSLAGALQAHNPKQPPLTFEPNLGQTDARVRYLARAGDYNLFLTATDAVMVMPVNDPVAASTTAAGKPEVTAETSQDTAPALFQSIGMQLAPNGFWWGFC